MHVSMYVCMCTPYKRCGGEDPIIATTKKEILGCISNKQCVKHIWGEPSKTPKLAWPDENMNHALSWEGLRF